MKLFSLNSKTTFQMHLYVHCIHICVYTYIHTYIHAFIHTYIQTDIYIYIYVERERKYNIEKHACEYAFTIGTST